VLCTDNVLGLLVLADKYNIADLKSSCVEYMRHHLVGSSDDCCAVLWYQYSLACSSSDLQQSCLTYIVLNMDNVMHSAHWVCLDCDNLVAVLRRSDIIVDNEYAVLQVRLVV